MKGLVSLIKLAERRTEQAVLAWQRLRAQCDDAKQKLALLQKHAEGYRDLMRTGLRQGMRAASSTAHIDFIHQIDAVAVRQGSELGQLEQACARQWEELVSARRDQRMYEILQERAAARDAATASRHQQVESDEAVMRAARTRHCFRRSVNLTNNGI
jgi:flagellar export protein FliJ